eukprot:7102568-Karenia_brevis.AAC.1
MPARTARAKLRNQVHHIGRHVHSNGSNLKLQLISTSWTHLRTRSLTIKECPKMEIAPPLPSVPDRKCFDSFDH